MAISPADSLDFQSRALVLRAARQEVLAANIANADTPNYKARDIDFAKVLNEATSRSATAQGDINSTARAAFRVPEQASGDGNTVDMDRERANFADNAVRYEATLRFINGRVRGLLSAIRGD
jgi:flagellar basal-body rod protein FlgB